MSSNRLETNSVGLGKVLVDFLASKDFTINLDRHKEVGSSRLVTFSMSLRNSLEAHKVVGKEAPVVVSLSKEGKIS